MVSAGALVLAGLTLYKEGPPPGHTGGFGEATCRQCHFDAALNEPGGQLVLRGVPEGYRPGHSYQLVVSLRRSGMRRAGFQLAARFAERGAAGRQAGALEAADQRARVVRDSARGILYLQHTLAGTAIAGDSTTWAFLWMAPPQPLGPVVFHVAANAANDDDSPLGDFIYTSAVTVEVRVARD